MGFPGPRPVTQQEIFKEVSRRIFMMRAEGLWKHKQHGHNWIERRVNELCTQDLGPKDENGLLKIARIRGDNLYEPNPERLR